MILRAKIHKKSETTECFLFSFHVNNQINLWRMFSPYGEEFSKPWLCQSFLVALQAK